MVPNIWGSVLTPVMRDGIERTGFDSRQEHVKHYGSEIIMTETRKYAHLADTKADRLDQAKVISGMYLTHLNYGLAPQEAATHAYRDLRTLGWAHDEAVYMVAYIAPAAWQAPRH
jgi:hypothetical protein